VEHVQLFIDAARAGDAPASDVLELPHWTPADWDALLSRASFRKVEPSEIVIARGALERSLHFTVAGGYEVGSGYVGGLSITSLARIPAGSVLGEQSFFDGLPRSANVWAHGPGELLTLSYEHYLEFATQSPLLARDLVFALARILSLRLRNTTMRVH
jgi:CRP-like cAMP-binding protein